MPAQNRLEPPHPLPPSLQALASSTALAPLPSIDELFAINHTLLAAKKAAEERAAVCREAAAVQRGLIGRARKEEDGRVVERERVKVEVGERRDREAKEEEKNKRDREREREREKERREEQERERERERNRARATGTGTPAPQVIKVKRELSESPAGSTIDIPNSQAPKKKKRKVDAALSGSPDPISERGTPAPRVGSPSVGPPTRPPATTNGSGSGPGVIKLKVKLNVGSDKPSKTTPSGFDRTPSLPPPPPSTSHISFHLPPTSTPTSASLIPPRQPIPPAPTPGPKRQKDVTEDFSTAKHVQNQVPLSQFWTSMEGWMREIGEDDLAMLGFRANDPEPFSLPALGRHYQDIWDEEDSQMPFSSSSNAHASSSSTPVLTADDIKTIKARKWIPTRDLGDEELLDDVRGLGGFAERVVSAFWAGGRMEERKKEVKEGEGVGEGEPVREMNGANGANGVANGHAVETAPGETQRLDSDGDVDMDRAGPSSLAKTSLKGKEKEKTPVPGEEGDGVERRWPILPHKIVPRKGSERPDFIGLDVGDLEEGLKRELRAVGLLDPGEEVDWSLRQDDEISAALRQCQKLLRKQLNVNDARKTRLAELARCRLAYSEYKHTLEGMEQKIASAWSRRTSRKQRKGKGKDKHEDYIVMGGKKVNAPLPDDVKKTMAARRKWIDGVGKGFDLEEEEGKWKGLPTKTVYEGLDLSGKVDDDE